MAALVVYDFLVDHYVDFSQSFTYLNGQTQSPTNFYGYTAQLMVRVNDTDASPLISIGMTASSSGQITLSASPSSGGVLNMWTVAITNAALSASGITAGLRAFYDLIAFSPASTPIKIKLATGAVIVAPTATH